MKTMNTNFKTTFRAAFATLLCLSAITASAQIQVIGIYTYADTADGDTILYAVGMKPFEQPYFDLYDKAAFVCQVGDCKKVGKVDGAIHTGFFAAMDIGMI